MDVEILGSGDVAKVLAAGFRRITDGTSATRISGRAVCQRLQLGGKPPHDRSSHYACVHSWISEQRMDARVQAAALKVRAPSHPRGALALTVAAALLIAQGAHADIYTYVDTKGRVTVSNVEPPDDARVTSVVRSRPSPPRSDPPPEASGNATVTALTRRVAQLEDELEAARSQPALPPAPPVVYPVIATAPPVVTTQAIVYNVAPSAPAADYGCASWWAGCGLSWWAPPVLFIGSSPVARHSGRFDRRRDHGLNRPFMSRPPLFPPSLRATPP